MTGNLLKMLHRGLRQQVNAGEHLEFYVIVEYFLAGKVSFIEWLLGQWWCAGQNVGQLRNNILKGG